MRMRWYIGGTSYSRGVKAFRPVRRLFPEGDFRRLEDPVSAPSR